MRRISISELSTLRWSFHQDVIRYATHGFDSIGIWRHKIDDFDIFETVDFLHEMRMNVSSVHWAGGFTGGEGMTYQEAIDDAKLAIEHAGRMGADCLIVHPGCRNGHTLNHARRLFVDALERLVPVAEDYGVALAIEPMPCASAAAWTFFDSFGATLELLENFPKEQIGLVLDLYHVGFCPDTYDDLKNFAERIKLVQVADRRTELFTCENRLRLGTGQVPLDRWLRALQDGGYQGQYEIEIHGKTSTKPNYHELLNSTTDFFGQDSIHQLLSSEPIDKRSRLGSEH